MNTVPLSEIELTLEENKSYPAIRREARIFAALVKRKFSNDK